MPPAPQPQPGRQPPQEAEKHYITFRQFEGMDTQSNRIALPANKLAWCENLQPVGPNDLLCVPGPNTALAFLPVGEVATRTFFANFGPSGAPIDYLIAFTVSGAAYTCNINTGIVFKFANAGTFSATPDLTQWKSERILIADPTKGYCTYDGSNFVGYGGVSPNINVTAGGSGYTTGATAAISGGSGAGATASVTVVGGVVVAVNLTNPGSGYKAGDTLTCTISPVGLGSGATATCRVWPIFTTSWSTLAVFQGRVWIAGGRNYTFTGTAGYDDVSLANAAGSAILTDADLPHQITAFRALNNFLYIFGDGSIKQIGSIAVSSSITVFSITTLSSDQGTIYPLTIQSYNRLIVFANAVGVYAIFGATIEKISDPMDGLFRSLDLTQPLVATANDINNIRCYLLLARYIDPVQGTRSVFLGFMNKKWFLASQGAQIKAVCTANIGGTLESFASSTNDLTQILQAVNTPVSIKLQTALSDDNKMMLGKRAIRVGIAHQNTNTGFMTMTSDSENGSFAGQYFLGDQVNWINNNGQLVQFRNSLSLNVLWFSTVNQFLYEDQQMYASGIYLGITLTGLFAQLHINSLVIEYVKGTLLRSKNHP